jgi:hypothetical protein
MQSVPYNALVVGVEYRIHMNADGDGALDYLGVFLRKIVFADGDIRYLFDHLVEPIVGAPHINGEVEHRRRPDDRWLLSVDPETHTLFVTAKNKAVQRVIASATGRTVQRPLLTQYFGRKSKRLTKGKSLSKGKALKKSSKK